MLHYLAFGGQQLIREKYLIDFVLRLLIDNAPFQDSIPLQVNKNGYEKIKPRVKATIKRAIIPTIDRLQNSAITRLKISY
jgi:hypothetical protein